MIDSLSKHSLLILFLLVLVSGCSGQQSKLERDGEPDIYYLGNEDQEMNKAIKEAKETYGDFLSAFKEGENPTLYFSVKMPFKTVDDNLEHIWLADISGKKDKLYGRVGNIPDAVKNLTLGQKVEIDEEKISDWIIIDDGKLVGGYTIRVIRNRMSKSEQEDFDREFGVIID